MKLINFSTHNSYLDMFDNDYKKIMDFINKYQFQGLELIQYFPWNPSIIPACLIKGFHMAYWPIWLDFWQGNKNKLLEQFKDKEAYIQYYGGNNRKVLIENYQKELNTAKSIKAQYIVFHVSHVQLKHCYNYNFTYSDQIIIDSFIEMINEVMPGQKFNGDLLLENLWWPGLTFLDKKIIQTLLEKIKYKKVGFMLDIAHLMNTNLDLKNEDESVDYIFTILDRIKDFLPYIKGIHLNSSLSGHYVKQTILQTKKYDYPDFFQEYNKVYQHIAKIDQHKPFKSKKINMIIDYIKPKYLIYEFQTDSFQKLTKFVQQQDAVLN